MQRVWWSVEVEDDRGTTTTSAPAWFETGLLSPDDWRAQWIEAEDPLAKADRAAGLRWVWSPTALDSRPHAFRLDFDAPADIDRKSVGEGKRVAVRLDLGGSSDIKKKTKTHEMNTIRWL